YRAKPEGAGGGNHACAGGSGSASADGELYRGARHGNFAGRPNRDCRPATGVPGADGGKAVLRNRVGEVEHRTSGKRGGDRGPDQSAAADAARGAGAIAACGGAKPAYRLRDDAVSGAAGAGSVDASERDAERADAGVSADRRAVVIRGGRIKRACHRGGIPESGGQRGG
ncbi:hypothetical protein NLX82_27580, partial [Paenibacillus sp. A3M_27_13]|nr:hypothetical protein [Paenibacillus sp. A3M_27_13]